MSQAGKGIFLNLDHLEHKKLKVAAAEEEITMTEIARQAVYIWHALASETRSDLLKAVGYYRPSSNGHPAGGPVSRDEIDALLEGR
jgi:hypothetical protein